MWVIGGLLIYLAIKKEMEPTLLLPIGFGAILVNLPGSTIANDGQIIKLLYDIGIANEFFPLVLFIGIGAMIDFGPVLTDPKLMLFGAAAQFGIFFTLSMATLLGFSGFEAASISIIGAADGPTSIVVARELLGPDSRLFGPIVVAAYSYMALVPIIQRPVVKLITTKKERLIRMEYHQRDVSKTTRILFPIVITAVVGFIAPDGLPLIGCLMFGNLIRECGVLNSISETAQKVLANLITIFLGISIAATMGAKNFLHPDTLKVLCLGLVAFIFDTVGGVFFAKFINLFAKKKVNPMIGACGISAFPMSARVIHKMGQEEDNQNFLLMHAIGANVSGQIASVVAGGLILSIFSSAIH
ncbi:MAG: sodium ion-translocating decarboxylase subunit beta [Clostridia bacterium]|nr:sodium ion-translocating decarboxylase subunit beta [Clostridia bacterium]MBR6007346.1 sodium ion-translocating decarboxylase subunit beta [Clostridia bacterium]